MAGNQMQYRNWRRKLIVVSIMSLALSDCGLVQRRQQSGETTFRDVEPPTAAHQEAPPPPKSTPKRVGIILGPGGAKALAHAGVIKELSRARVPLTHVVGIEWGSLIGALFAQKGQPHEMEWKLYKIEKQTLPSKSFFSSQLQAGKTSELRGYLTDSLGMGGAAPEIHFSCPSQWAKTGEVKWSDGQPLATSVEACLGLPPFYSAKQGPVAEAFAIGEAAQRMRAAGAEMIILVNVLNQGELFNFSQLPDSGASAILWNEIRRNMLLSKSQVDFWIEVPTQGIGISEFERRRDAVAAGEQAGRAAAKQLTDRYGF